MDFKKTENGKHNFNTPSTNAKRLVEKVMNSNSNCDHHSPFRYLPHFSTPPSRLFKVKNPFDSPLRERLHLPICSPGLFAKSTPKREDKFKWTICDISNLKPAEIETTSVEDNAFHVDPSVEFQIQESISSFFSQNSVVPSPMGQNTNEIFKMISEGVSSDITPQKVNTTSSNHVSTQTSISLKPILPKFIEQVLKSYENYEEGKCLDEPIDVDAASGIESYLPEEMYYKKLFDFENESPQSSPPLSTGDSPLQFSPLKELEICSELSFSDHADRKELNECALSPITPEAESPHQKDRTNNVLRESRSACRLVFTENMSLDHSDNNVVPDMLDQISNHGNFFDDTVKTTDHKTADSSAENWDMEYKHVSLASQEYDESKMDISLPHTPNTGLFTSQRKRLSNSFKDMDELLGHSGELNFPLQPSVVRPECLLEGSSDTGYHSGSGVIVPSSSIEGPWSSSHLFASTPTKRKAEAKYNN